MEEVRRLTQAYLDELWERIEDMERRLIANPDDRGVAMLLDCCLRNYEAKLRLFQKDTESFAYVI
jgi:hypothetical protein